MSVYENTTHSVYAFSYTDCAVFNIHVSIQLQRLYIIISSKKASLSETYYQLAIHKTSRFFISGDILETERDYEVVV